MRILMTGGSGLLGQELKKYMKFDAPTHKQLDITQPIKVGKKYDLIIHAAAYTDVSNAEIRRDRCLEINVMGTYNLLRAFQDTPFVYISSEYVRNPVNFYSHTKLIGEYVVSCLGNPYLIIRTLFKPTPFPFVKAFSDQYTTGDYVDVIAPLIYKEIKKWGAQEDKMTWIGTGRKTIWELAKRTRPEVLPCSIKDVAGVILPQDYE